MTTDEPIPVTLPRSTWAGLLDVLPVDEVQSELLAPVKKAVLARFEAHEPTEFEFDASEVFEILRQAGVARAECFFHGNGDEGWTEPPVFYAADAKSSMDVINVDVIKIAVQQAVEQACNEAISAAGLNGYENNEGGEGYVTIDAVANTVVISMGYNSEEPEEFFGYVARRPIATSKVPGA